MALTIWARRGCDCSKSSTDERNPCSGKFTQLRILLGARGFVRGKLAKLAMLSACSAWVLESSATSVFNVPSSFNSSCLALGAYGIRAADFRFNFADGFFDHV